MSSARKIRILLSGGLLAAGLWLAPGAASFALAQDQDADQNAAGEDVGAENGLPPGIVPGEEGETPEGELVDIEEDEPPAPQRVAPPPSPRYPKPTPRRRPPARGTRPGKSTAKITVSNNKVNLDFADADIQDVVKQISEITGRNFILDERVRGKITIISPSPVTIDEAYRVFESVLQVKGFTTIQVGDFIKIIPLREAKQSYTSILPGGTLVPRRDEYITRLIPLRYVDATD
ncbi:MAG: hypothetical protein ACE5FC_09755, partial [Myxococcota bacterium]